MSENFTPGEKKEENIETAQVMASSINKFVDQGIMTAKEAGKLAPDKIDEFMCRSVDDIIHMPDKIPEENKGKLRTMLGLHLTEFDKPVDKVERQFEIKETVTEMRDYFTEFQKEFPFAKGFILCGSKMVADKMPRPDSDVDVVTILDEGYETSHEVPGGQELVQKMVEFTNKNKTKSGAEVSLDDFYTMSNLYKELESDKVEPGKGKLIWGFNPEAIKYIGDDLKFKDTGLNEKEVNKLLDLYLNSAKTKKLKEKLIAETKQRITGSNFKNKEPADVMPELKERPVINEEKRIENPIPRQDLEMLRKQEQKRVEAALEEERSEMMLDTIVKEGGAMLYSTNNDWLQTALRARERVAERSNQIHDRSIRDTFFITQEKMRIGDKNFKKEGINEVVSLEPMIRKERIIKTRPKKKFFGLVDAQEQYYEDRSRQINHNEIVVGGENEPAVLLNYEVQDSDADGATYMRAFKLGIPLPLSLADVVAKRIKEDPTFIRKITEQMMIRKLGITRMVWEHGVRGDDFMPMRPPYEAWRKNKGFSKIYYQEGSSSKYNPNNVYKF